MSEILSHFWQMAARNVQKCHQLDGLALHDFRVGIREVRVWYEALQSIHPSKHVAALESDVRWLAKATNVVRDGDVIREWIKRHTKWQDPKWADERAEELDLIKSAFPTVHAQARAHIAQIHEMEMEGRLKTAREETKHFLDAQRKILRERIAIIRARGNHIVIHQARVSAKRVRYLLEPLFPVDGPPTPEIERLKAAQYVLGELVDLNVTRQFMVAHDHVFKEWMPLIDAQEIAAFKMFTTFFKTESLPTS